MEYISIAFLAVTVAVCFLSSASDIRFLKIPNWHPGVIIISFFPAYFLAPEGFFPLWQHIAAMGIMFIVSYGMFHFNVMGGGDSKLATAVSLWLGLKLMLPFMLYMAIAGGVLGIATILMQKKKPFKNPIEQTWFSKAQQGVNEVPYGIAITMGYLLSVFHIPMIVN